MIIDMAPWISTQFAKHHRAIQAQAILAPPRLAVPPPNLMMMRACGRKGCHTIWSSLAALRYWSPMTVGLFLFFFLRSAMSAHSCLLRLIDLNQALA